jgi:glycosyltransferase involved in cell wall biosynthesis/SAM-dependent methyltransferase
MRLADLRLALFFTRGISLQVWDQIGMFEREVALYRRLRPQLGSIAFVTYGDAGDLAYAPRLPGIDILCNQTNLAIEEYAQSIPDLHQARLQAAHVLKTNQIPGAEVAVAVKQRYGHQLVARCGYMWSDLAAHSAPERQAEAEQARQVETLAFGVAERVVVTTQTMLNYVKVNYGVPDARLKVIPNYVLTDLFSPQGARSLPNRVCFVGRLSPEKNPLALVQACAGLNVEVVMVGSGPLQPAIEQLAQQLRVNLRLAGNLPHLELPNLLRQSAAFVLVSHHEGHPKTLLEAMACGLPVIGANSPGIRELIAHGQNGYLCDPDAASIRAALETVLGDAGLRARLGKNARQFVVEHFSLDRIETLELEMLERLINRHALGRVAGHLAGWLCRRPAAQPLDVAASPVPVPPPNPADCRGGPSLTPCPPLPVGERETGSYRPLPPRGEGSQGDEGETTRPPPSPAHKAAALADEAEAYAHTLEPAEALRFLFDLDARLYPLQGQLAVAYGGGLHTKHRHTRYHDFFVQRVRAGERVLDIGCGNGAVAFDIAEKAWAEVTGIDLAEPNIAVARQRYPHPRVRYLVGDAMSDLPDERFDVIVMSNVLEHLEQRSAFLRAVQARYQPARWLIRVPLFERDWRVPLKQELGVEYRLDPMHTIEYTPETFASELRQAGLQIDHQEIRWGEIWAEAHGCVPNYGCRGNS